MTDSQWRFELESLYALEEKDLDKFKLIAEIAKKWVIKFLGLDLMPIPEELSEEEKLALAKVGEDTSGSYRLRRPNDDEILPLAILIGHPEMVSEIVKKRYELYQQEQIDANVEIDSEIPPEDLIDDPVEDNTDIPEFIDPKDFGKYMKWMGIASKSTKQGMLESIDDLEKDEDLFVKSDRAEKLGKKAKISIDY